MITSSSRPSLNLAWGLIPHWTQALTPVSGPGLDAAKITLAHVTLEVIRELDGVRSDLARMRARYPGLAALLDGRSQLPPQPGSATKRMPRKPHIGAEILRAAPEISKHEGDGDSGQEP
jgi:hypothetical protein